MKTNVVWKEQMRFEATSDSLSVLMDAKPPIGQGSAPTPKEMVMFGMGGCTAMDVIALLKKYKQTVQGLQVEVDVTPSQGKQPAVFEKAELTFIADGAVDSNQLLEAVRLSMTKFCGVNAMLAKAFPIAYRVVLNGVEIGTGRAEFAN